VLEILALFYFIVFCKLGTIFVLVYNLFMLGNKLCIDLGTSRSVISTTKNRDLISEPTVVATSSECGEVLSVGEQAKELLGRTTDDISACRPMQSGVIADYEKIEIFLAHLINRVVKKNSFLKPEVILSVPCGATSVESRAVIDATYSVGAKNVYLVPSPLLAAIGAGLPVSQPSGNVVVTMGAGITETAVVSLYGIVNYGSLRLGGADFDDAIIHHIRRKYGLVIGISSAEEVKISLGDALSRGGEVFFEVKGRDSITGFPKITEVSSTEISACLAPLLEKISLSIQEVLGKMPPELATDVLDKGITLTGGLSQMTNIDKYISDCIGVPVHVSDSPQDCVINGLLLVLDHIDQFSKSMIKR